MSNDCIFCKIASGAIPVEAIYQNEEFFAFRDSNPVAPVHVLLVPKKHYSDILDIEDAGLLGRGIVALQETVKILGLAQDGFRTVINTKDNGGQTVYHLHFHILGGRFMQWPPG